MIVPEEVPRSFDEGASIVHLHIKHEEANQTTDPSIFEKDVEEIHSQCPIIIEGSTGGPREHTLENRCNSSRIPEVEIGYLNLASINITGEKGL